MAQIEILHEQELPTGWVFEAHVLDGNGSLHRIRLTLSWADYNLWSPDGADEPQQVAEAVLDYLASQQPIDEIRPRLDASLVRRMFADADTRIPMHIRRQPGIH